MKSIINSAIMLAMCGMLLSVDHASAADYEQAPEDVRCAIILKVLGFNKSLTGDITIHVLGDPAFAEELTKHLGKSVGKSITIGSVESIDLLQETPPDVLYVGDDDLLSDAIVYARKHKLLTIGKTPEMPKKGLSLGVGLDGKRPKILLNPGASKKEGVKWSPTILKLAVIIKSD